MKDIESFKGKELKLGSVFDPRAVPCSFSLILMDCNMPFMDGYECTQRLRKLFYDEFKASVINQPIISATTGHAETKYIKKCFGCGMNQVLSKPLQSETLLSSCVQSGITTLEQVEYF